MRRILAAAGALLLSLGCALPQTYPGVLSTNVQTANYSIAANDCARAAVLAGTGATGLFTVTLTAAAGFPEGCRVTVKNGDTGRGKLLSGFPSDLTSILWPQQQATVAILNGAWTTVVNPLRWRLPGNTTFNVNASLGSDSNDGLASGAGAFATVLAAYTTLQTNVDFNGQVATLQLANATYTNLNFNNGWIGSGKFVLDGGGGTINGTGGTDAVAIAVPNANSTIDSFTIQNATLGVTSGAGAALHCQSGFITIGTGITFAAATAGPGIHINADSTPCHVWITNNYTISGGANVHFFAVAGGVIDQPVAKTVTLTGTPAFGVFADAITNGIIYIPSMVFSGSASAGTSKFLVAANGTLAIGAVPGTACAVGTASLPGGTNGTIANGGTCY